MLMRAALLSALCVQGILCESCSKRSVFDLQLDEYTDVSMNIVMADVPTSVSHIFSIADVLDISITPESTIQVSIGELPTSSSLKYPIQQGVMYALDLMFVSNSMIRYSWQSQAAGTLAFSPISSLFVSSHLVVLETDANSEICDLQITDSDANLFPEMNDDRILLRSVSWNGTTASPDEYMSMFGPDVSQIQEIVIFASVVVAAICMSMCAVIVVLRNCVSCLSKKHGLEEPNQSYEEVEGTTPVGVSYVDERPGNHDLFNIPVETPQDEEKNGNQEKGVVPLGRKVSRVEGEPKLERVTTNGTVTSNGTSDTIGTNSTNGRSDTYTSGALGSPGAGSTHGIMKDEEHEESISAMNI